VGCTDYPEGYSISPGELRMARLNLPQCPIEPFNVLAFDPGGTSGWALGQIGMDQLDHPSLLKPNDINILTGELGPNAHHSELLSLIQRVSGNAFACNLPALEVVSEPFHYRQNIVGEGEGFRGKVELISAEYIGVIKLDALRQLVKYLIVKRGIQHPLTTVWRRK
jgi:hypothetical protein